MASPRKIKTTPNHECRHCSAEGRPLTLGGWFNGRGTYLWIGSGDHFHGELSGQRLYRLAKAIVRQWEEE